MDIHEGILVFYWFSLYQITIEFNITILGQTMQAHHFQSGKKQNQSQTSFKPEEQFANVSAESCPIPEHLQNSELIQNLSAASKNKLFTKFKWNQQFRTTLDVQVIEGNFETMRVKLHYGNYELEILVIYTEIEEQMIEKDNSKSGSFGVVRFVAFEDKKYAVKGVKYELKDGDIDAEEAYKQYFLCVVADVLEVGPKVLPLFGYDILLTKGTAFFAIKQCKPAKLQSIETNEAELLKNLQIMHSLNFTHVDIKIDNIAFSSLLKKHIFIDFGLSKILKQPPGQKTKTKFQGTLSYCSDEMKKCYLLARICFVDLYENDLCCLKKTKKALENLLKVNNFLKLDNLEEKGQPHKFKIFEKIISVLRLKYNLQIMNLKEVLNILENKTNIKRVVYEILKNSLISNAKAKAQDQETINKIRLIKEEIFNKHFKADPVDTFLCGCFNQTQRTHSIEEIIPISQILQSNQQFFSHYLTKSELILKIFHFFQPFVYQNPNFIQKNQFNLRKTLVNKIYQTQQPSYKKSVLFFQKMQFSLGFFYNKFKDFKNVGILDQMRVTFASSPHWKFMWEIQDEIISLIQCPFLKMLRILEFYFYALLILQFQAGTSQNRVLSVKEKIPSNLNSLRQMKAKSFFLSIKKKSQFLTFSLEQKKQMLNQINQISSDCVTADEKESNQNTKRIFIELCLAVRGDSLKYNSQSQEETTFLSSLAKNQHELKQRYSRNLPKRMIQKLTLRQKQQIQSSSKKIIGRDSGYFDGVQIFEILQRFYKEFKNKQTTENELFAMFVNLNWFVECACQSRAKSQDEAQTTRQNRMKSIDKIQRILNLCVEDQKAKLIIARNLLIQIHFRIFHIKFSLLRGKTSQDQQKQIQSVFNMLKPLNSKHPQLVLPLFSINKYIYPQFIQNRPHFYKEILLSIAEQFVAQKQFSIFQNEGLIFKDLVLIRNEKGKESENLDMILSLMKDYEGTIKADDSKLPFEVFLQGVKYFLMNLTSDKLVNIYDKIKYNKQQLKQGLYGYFVFLIYQKTKSLLNRADQLKQVVRTTLCLKYMLPICQTKVKPALLNVSRALVSFQSKRKSFIFRRLEMKVAGKNKIGVIAEEIGNKIEKIKKRYENVFNKLDGKVSNFKRL